MQSNTGIIEQYRQKKLSYYRWRVDAGVAAKLALAVGVACLTGLLAQVKIYLPWTPVPVVASQLGIILAAVLLGKRWGGLSMLIYALGGVAGIPWFAGFKGGLAVLAGPTGGYILGYILAALFLGSLFDARIEARRTILLTATVLFSLLVLVYIPGMLHLAFWLSLAGGQSITISGIFWLGFTPFIAGDLLKALIGAGIAKALVTMEKY